MVAEKMTICRYQKDNPKQSVNRPIIIISY
jgi:hypothetical protein